MSADNPKWGVTLEDAEGPYVVVPWRLAREQRILDQPPYAWMQVDTSVIPNDLFVDPDTVRTMIVERRKGHSVFNGYPRGFLTGSEEEKLDDLFAVCMRAVWFNDSHLMEKIITEPYQRVAMSRINYMVQYLNKFPYAHGYLRTKWVSDRFDLLGRPKLTGFQLEPSLTYVAWRGIQDQLVDKARWEGLTEELPDFSAADEMFGALPHRGAANDRFRLYHSGAMGFEAGS